MSYVSVNLLARIEHGLKNWWQKTVTTKKCMTILNQDKMTWVSGRCSLRNSQNIASVSIHSMRNSKICHYVQEEITSSFWDKIQI
jgi:hypothetical protein